MTAFSFPPLPIPKIWHFVVTEPSGPTPGTPLRRSFVAAPRLSQTHMASSVSCRMNPLANTWIKPTGGLHRPALLQFLISKQEFGMLFEHFDGTGHTRVIITI